MTATQISGYLKDTYGECRHDVYALAEAINLTSEDLENERIIKIPSSQELLQLLIENKPIPYLMTHSYTFHTRTGRYIIEKMKHYYYEQI